MIEAELVGAVLETDFLSCPFKIVMLAMSANLRIRQLVIRYEWQWVRSFRIIAQEVNE